MSSCPDVKRLERMALGTLGATESAELRNHLASCDACAHTLDELKSGPTLHGKPLPADDDDVDAEVDEAARRRFEADWQRGRAEAIDAYLPSPNADSYPGTVEELVHIEMEFRHKAWSRGVVNEPPTDVSGYIARFPTLNRPAAIARLEDQQTRLRVRYPRSKTEPEITLMLGEVDGTPDPVMPRRLGRYVLGDVLGVGGMGMVYQAHDEQLDRAVAIKVMKPDLAVRRDARQRFLREARLAAKISHDRIVAVHTADEQAGIPYLAMPLLRGETLDARLKREGTLPLTEALRIGREIAEGLAAAHGHGMVHRDIKPSNVWLDNHADDDAAAKAPAKAPADQPVTAWIHRPAPAPRGHVKLMDFGLARPMEADVNLTFSGVLVGTPAYMAPEQARGEPVDGRTDLFGLGVVLYRMCTGQLPFATKDAMSTMMSIAMDPPTNPRTINPEVPESVSALILRLLAKSPAERPASAREVIATIAEMERTSAAESAGSPPSAPPPRRRAGWPVIAAGLAALAMFAAVAVAVFRVQTPQGEFVVEADDGRVAVALDKTGGLLLIDQKTKKEYTVTANAARPLPNGAYEIVVRDNQGDLEFSAQSFAIKDGKSTSIKVVFVGKGDGKGIAKVDPKIVKPPVAVVDDTPKSSDKEQPFVVVRAGGDKTLAATFARAMQLHQDGDIIEVHGNGPFRVNDYRAKDKTIVLRAAPGFRPQFRVEPHQLFLTLDNVRLRVEGCDFRCPFVGGSGSYLFGGGGPEWTFKNCRFLMGVGPVAHFSGQKMTYEDCLILVQSGFGGGSWITAKADRFELKNCAARLPQPMLPITPLGKSLSILLENNTIVCHGNFFDNSLEKLPGKSIAVEARGNIFERNQSNGNLLYLAFAKWKDTIAWTGSNNLYVQTPAGSEVVFTADAKKEPRKETRKRGLAAWFEIWGKEELGSKEADNFTPQWRAIERAQTPEAMVSALKPAVDAVKVKLPGLGPDWTLVGPGAAYVRALAAQGKPVAKDRLRPPPLEGAPFVVLHEGKVMKGYDQLAEAAARAADGDTIEVRTEDPIRPTAWHVAKGVKSLSLKAAPGYRPVIEGDAQWLAPGLSLTIEGFHFQDGGLMLTDWSHTGKGCRLARLANCSFAPSRAAMNTPSAVGNPWSFVEPASDGSMEIVNCLMPASLSLCLQSGATLTVDNSLLANVVMTFPEVKGVHRLDLRRSVIWHPATYVAPAPIFSGGAWQAKGPDFVLPEIHANDCLIDNGASLIGLGHPQLTLADWKGDRNAFRLGEHLWYNIYAANPPRIASLSAWKNQWSSDANSLQADPEVYDARAWRIAAGSPGEGHGADVTKIAK